MQTELRNLPRIFRLRRRRLPAPTGQTCTIEDVRKMLDRAEPPVEKVNWTVSVTYVSDIIEKRRRNEASPAPMDTSNHLAMAA